MQVDAVRLTPANLSLCRPLWGGREAYADGELDRVQAGAARFLSDGRARGAVIFEDKCARAFGITVFADEVFVSRYLDAVYPHVGKQLLLSAHHPASTPVLGRAQVAERNAGEGLQLVVTNTAYDVSAQEPDTVLGRLIAAFHQTHQGYRLARIVNEVFGAAAMSVVEDSRAYEIVRVFDPAPGCTGGSLVGTLTRAQAAAWKTPLLAMFAYSPPRLFFTAAEQQLITEALTGVTDETLNLYVAVTDEHRVLRVELRNRRHGDDDDDDDGDDGESDEDSRRGGGDDRTPFVTDYVRQGVNAPADFNNPDNLALDKAGNLFITEDTVTPPGMDIWMATPASRHMWMASSTVRFASLTDCGGEPSGIYFDLTGTVLFVHVLHRGEPSAPDKRDLAVMITQQRRRHD